MVPREQGDMTIQEVRQGIFLEIDVNEGGRREEMTGFRPFATITLRATVSIVLGKATYSTSSWICSWDFL